ncbi:hypothetical protein L1F30_02760 [Simiduia sp. 21SJ11W-1]|uniref:hypothetical protein n=1 Tax=Simiduia sp. 21SJ11W-1 TaxID=2909669 RepID=UPI00209EDD12|nr:hypothetical protein [Simiduia sp. 21SJ11W-1]UTA48474.1 hypothetical protein L1F30_02760 [Simiduia sp. 21SJ11W-1]
MKQHILLLAILAFSPISNAAMSEQEQAGRQYAKKTFGTTFPRHVNLEYCSYVMSDFLTQWPKQVKRFAEKDVHRQDRLHGFSSNLKQWHQKVQTCDTYYLKTKLKSSLITYASYKELRERTQVITVDFAARKFKSSVIPAMTTAQLQVALNDYIIAIAAMERAYFDETAGNTRH